MDTKLQIDHLENAIVGDLVGIDNGTFKAMALIIQEKNCPYFGKFFDCLVLKSNLYEYEYINVYVKANPIVPKWHRIIGENKKPHQENSQCGQ